MAKKTIGIIGCGAIGTALAEYAANELRSRVDKILLWDRDIGISSILEEKSENILVAESMDDLAEKADLVIEAASPAAVPEVFKAALARRKDIMIMSIGGVLGNEKLLDSAREKGARVMLPSGAISGVDALKASAVAGLESVTITTRKPPRSVKGAPYLSEKGTDVDAIKEETVIFEGNALEAIKGFPKNVNVSALLSLAGIGPERTKVRIVVSPEYTRNTHEIEIVSGAGKVFTRTENLPSPSNPKTSYLAALSAITSLRDYFDTVRIGT